MTGKRLAEQAHDGLVSPPGRAAAGPLLVGRLRDLTGDFGASLRLLAGVALAMLLLTPFLRPRRDAGPHGTVRP